MSITEIQIPEKAKSNRASKLTSEELATALELLADEKAVSDDVVYLPIQGKKRDTKTIAYDAGYLVRAEIAAEGTYDLKELKVRTWEDKDEDGKQGHRWAVVRK